MKWFVYNLLFALVFPFLLPGFLVRMLRRGGYRARMGDRFALYPKSIVDACRAAEGSFVWIHAVSVGEVQVAGQLMREWRKADPSVRFCFSTTSSTGWKMAEREVKVKGEGEGEGEECGDILIYNPLDFPSFVKSALRLVRPRAIVLTESEIWPVFIRAARKRGIPIFLINARVSDRSAPRYRLARFFFRDVFDCFTRIFAQSDLDRSRLLAAGAPADRTVVTGSFKFDVAHRNPAKEAELRAWIDPPENAWILLGGSTWPGEDEALLRIYRDLLNRHLTTLDLGYHPKPILVIAPRHFEKADAVEANIRKAGFDCVRRSRGDGSRRDACSTGENVVYLADTTGELMGLYGIADAVFVGKSLCAHGSQNMIEPCLCGKPTAVGPYTENFRPVMSDLQEGEGIAQVRDEDDLAKTLADWFANGDGGLGARARAAVERRCGVVPKCVRTIASSIPRRAAAAPRHGGGSVWKGLLVTALFLAVVGGACRTLQCFGPWATTAAVTAETPFDTLYAPLKALFVHIALLEKPDAKRVWLADGDSRALADAFADAGLKSPAARKPEGRYDIVVVTEAPRKWKDVLESVSETGVIVWCLDVRKRTAADLKAALAAFPCPEFHFWMPSETEWMVVGRLVPRTVKLNAVLELFDRGEKATADLAEAECAAVTDLFASYVGDRRAVMGAFAQGGDLRQTVTPEIFVTRDVPSLDWLSRDGVEEDIYRAMGQDFERVQKARRLVLQGSMLSRHVAETSGKGMDAMITKWKSALTLNAHDPMMLDRLHRLQINAWTMERVGNFKGAASCYELMLVLRPRNAAALRGLSGCLRNLGKAALAAELLKKAEEVEK